MCYLSALVLFVFYTCSPLWPYRSVFAWTHRIAGVCLFVLPTIVLITHRDSWRLHIKNVVQGWIWTLDDVRWLARIGLAAIDKSIVLPDQGKFNAGEKMNFMMVMTSCPLFVVTGFLIWLPDISFYSWLVHVLLAAVATPLLFGHIFMATINPGTRVGLSGMISGYVDRKWAKHHYHRWYKENFGEDRDELENGEPVRRRPGHGLHSVELARQDVVDDHGHAATSPRRKQGENPYRRAPSSISAVKPTPGLARQRRSNLRGNVEVVARARRLFGENPAAAIAMLEVSSSVSSSSSADVLQALSLMKLATGDLEEAIDYGQRALRECLKLGHARLVAELLEALWPHVEKLSLNRNELHSSAAALLRTGRLALAAEACGHAIRRDPKDSEAIEQLLQIAQITRDMNAPETAIKVYNALLKNTDASLEARLRLQRHEAWRELCSKARKDRASLAKEAVRDP